MPLFVIGSSSLLCTGHQSRNIRVKKRGAISSAWLEKYKPELPDDADHRVLPSDSLVENTFESENILSDEKNSIAEEKGLDRENTTLSTTGQSKISCISGDDEEISQNSITVEERNGRKKYPKIKTKTNILASANEDTCSHKREDNTVVTSKPKEREEKKCPNEDLHPKVSDSHQTSRKSCTSVSDLVTVGNPIMSSNDFGKDTESALIEDATDSPQEIVRNKRKANGKNTEMEKPCKRFRCESNAEEEICEEGKV